MGHSPSAQPARSRKLFMGKKFRKIFSCERSEPPGPGTPSAASGCPGDTQPSSLFQFEGVEGGKSITR
jgi:hypothetical protein